MLASMVSAQAMQSEIAVAKPASCPSQPTIEEILRVFAEYQRNWEELNSVWSHDSGKADLDKAHSSFCEVLNKPCAHCCKTYLDILKETTIDSESLSPEALRDYYYVELRLCALRGSTKK
jgi:hypothetical protein